MSGDPRLNSASLVENCGALCAAVFASRRPAGVCPRPPTVSTEQRTLWQSPLNVVYITPDTRHFGSDPQVLRHPGPDRNPNRQLRAVPAVRTAASQQKRKDEGLEAVLREIFPIESYDKSISLEYLRYELGKPRYEPDECRQLRLTYGRPFRVWLRLNKRASRSRRRSTWATCRS